MRNAKCEIRSAKCEMRNAKCEIRNAKCEIRNAKCEMRNSKMRNAEREISIYSQLQFAIRNLSPRCYTRISNFEFRISNFAFLMLCHSCKSELRFEGPI